ncbi:hypothetical protein ACJX0J_019214, partial [Zea mays]
LTIHLLLVLYPFDLIPEIKYIDHIFMHKNEKKEEKQTITTDIYGVFLGNKIDLLGMIRAKPITYKLLFVSGGSFGGPKKPSNLPIISGKKIIKLQLLYRLLKICAKTITQTESMLFFVAIGLFSKHIFSMDNSMPTKNMQKINYIISEELEEVMQIH